MEILLITTLCLMVSFYFGWLARGARTLNDYNEMYAHLTAEIISRMTKAMRSLRMEQGDIDRVIERMGCKIMPTSVLTPPPTPPEKPAKMRDFNEDPYTLEEVMLRLKPHGDQPGEWYCTSKIPKMAWCIEEIDDDERIIRKTCLDMKRHELHASPEQDDTIKSLAQKIIDYNFCFLNDFGHREWR